MNRHLPDDETIEKAYRTAWAQSPPFASIPLDAGYKTFITALGLLRPDVVAYETREAERKAYMRGRAQSPVLCSQPVDDAYPTLPNPLEPKPPTLTLSTGVWTRTDAGWKSPSGGIWQTPLSVANPTATDAEKYAAWLRAHGSTEERV